MSYMSQSFRLLNVSNLSIRNFRIFLYVQFSSVQFYCWNKIYRTKDTVWDRRKSNSLNYGASPDLSLNMRHRTLMYPGSMTHVALDRLLAYVQPLEICMYSVNAG